MKHDFDLARLAYVLNRKALPRMFSRWLPYWIVNEFPKSGGGWVGHMLADALEVPFPRHRPLRLRSAIVHGHFLSHAGLHHVLAVWRDPRDVAVSFYHHCFFTNEFDNAVLVRAMKSRLPFDDYSDVRANLPAFLRLINEDPVSPDFTWAQFARAWLGRPGVTHVRYEDLRTRGAEELVRIVRDLSERELSGERAAQIFERHSFDRVKRLAEAETRRRGAEMSYVREGSIGGWRRHFSSEAEELAERYFGAEARRVGYW